MTLSAILIGGGLILCIPTLIGFGTVGIAAGSIAAAIQSSIGSVAAGSIFAQMTSWGMVGVFSKAACAGIASIAGGIGAFFI